MRTAVYARVSTSDQNCQLQLRELREYCQRRGWQVSGEYVDTWSGMKASRPQLDSLMKDASMRKFDAVCCWKIDRWGRSLSHLIDSVQRLQSLGIRFLAITQNIDTDQSNPMSRLLLHLLASFGEFERELIVERTRAGIANARSRGKTLGRPKRVFRRDDVIRLRNEGLSWRAIATRLEVPVSTCVDAVRCTENVSSESAGA